MARASLPSFYEILGVSREADAAEVKRAYRQASRSAHPDTGGNPALFHLLTVAYETLSDPARRAEYDRTLGTGVEGGTMPSQEQLQTILDQHAQELRSQWEAEQRRREAALAAERDALALQRLHALQRQGGAAPHGVPQGAAPQAAPSRGEKQRILLLRALLYASSGLVAGAYYVLRATGALSFAVPESGPIAQFHSALSGSFSPGLVFLFLAAGVLAEHFFEPAARIYVLKDARLRLPVAVVAAGTIVLGELLFTTPGKYMAAGVGLLAVLLLLLRHFLDGRRR